MQGTAGDICRYGAGDMIFREGDPGDYIYFVLRGSVQIRKEDDHFASALAKCTEGDLFGELAIVDSQPRSASAIALGDTELIRYDEDTFKDAVGQRPELALEIVVALGRKLRSTNEELQKVRAAYARSRSEDASAQDSAPSGTSTQ